MATYQGYSPPSSFYPNSSNISQNIVDGVEINHNPDSLKSSPALFSTGQAKNHPFTFLQTIHPGYWAGSYADIFFNKILIEPLFTNVGIVATEKILKITVSNLFLIQPKTMTQITGVNTIGIQLTGKAFPYTLGPLETIEYDLAVKVEGPPRVDVKYTFLFADPIHNQVVAVEGNRIVVFPYWFKPEMVEEFEWSTGIIKSRNGKEQRIRNRLSPRIKLTTQNYLQIGELFRGSNLISGWKGRVWALPLYHEARNLSQPLATGAEFVSASTANGSFVKGGIALVFKNSKIYDAVEIINISSNEIELRQGVLNSYDERCFLVPIQNAIMTSSPRKNSTGHDGQVDTEWTFLDKMPLGIAGNPPTQYKGKDVLLDNVFEILSPEPSDRVTYSQRMDIIDFDTGRIDFVAPETFTNTTKTVRFVVEGLANIWKFKEWLKRRSGKWSSFWMPSFESDMVPVDLGVLGPNITTVEGSYISQAASKNNAIVFFKDGTFAIKEIIGADAAAGGMMEISFNSSIGVSKEKIERISLLTVARFDTDRIEMKWYQGEKIFCDIPIREIKPNEL